MKCNETPYSLSAKSENGKVEFLSEEHTEAETSRSQTRKFKMKSGQQIFCKVKMKRKEKEATNRRGCPWKEVVHCLPQRVTLKQCSLLALISWQFSLSRMTFHLHGDLFSYSYSQPVSIPL